MPLPSSGDVGQNAADATVFDAFVPFERAFVMSGDTCIIQSSGAVVWCVGDETHLELGPLLDAGFDAGIADWGDQPRLFDITLGSLHVVSGGGDFACGVIAADRSTRCWGWDINGAFGDGSSASEEFDDAAAHDGNGSLADVQARSSATPSGRHDAASPAGASTAGDRTTMAVQASIRTSWATTRFARRTTRICRRSTKRRADSKAVRAIDTSHHVWCWGDNNWGQLGRGAASAFEWRPALVGCP